MKYITWMVLIAFIIGGCASYRSARLPSSDVESYGNYQNQDGLKIAVKFFEHRDTKKIFGTSKVADRYQPIYIVIDNRTNRVYQFKKSNLNKQSIPAEEVAKECGFSTVGRATTYGIAGLFIWPLLIPAVVDGVGSAQANQKMEDDYSYKEIKDERIHPNGLLNGIVFLDKIKDGEEIVIRIQDVETNEIKLFSFKK